MANSDGMIGQVLEHYRIDKVVGRGGMGTVYQATDLRLQQQVAVKVMNSSLADMERFRQRFQREAQSAARLKHPNIVSVMYFGMQNRILFIVMELIAAGSLRAYLRRLYEQRKFIELGEAVELARQIAEALNYAHQQGMIHLDVKPDNILLRPTTSVGKFTNFQAVLTDFGLAKLVEGATQSMRAQPAGTYAYMAPEHFENKELDGRADIYSLGVMMYELACGRLPYQPEPKNLKEAFQAHLTQTPPAPSSVRPGLPPELERLIMKCLAKRPKDRFQSAGELAQALQAIQISLPATKMAMPSTPPDQVDSLVTYVMSQAGMVSQVPVLEPPAPMPSDALQDRLVVHGPREQPRPIPIMKDRLVMGRDLGGDIVISDQKASRNHATVTYVDGRYFITDLGSTNGTWLDNTRLEANKAQVWIPGQRVRIGSTWIELEAAKQERFPDTKLATINRAEQQVTVAPTIQAADLSSKRVVVTLTPPAIKVEAGGRATASIEVLSQSQQVEHVTVQITDLPTGWYALANEELYLMPGERGNVVVTFFPPRTSASAAGQHQFTVRATVEHAAEAQRLPWSLQIAPFFGFETDMQPQRLRGMGRTTLQITNSGNTPDTYAVMGRDREQILRFSIVKSESPLMPGQSEMVPIRVETTKRHWLGATRTYPFEILVSSLQDTAKPPQTKTGEALVAPILPAWVLAAAALLLLCCILTTIFLVAQFSAQQAQNANQTAAAGTALVVTNAAVATAGAVSTANDATALANNMATAEQQAKATQGADDSDGDGLSNAREAELGTDPGKVDTDGDQLIDSQEIEIYGTNPTVADTDGDGLPDGVEVIRGTLPTIADTDGDGLPDGVDPNPLVPQSQVPTPVCPSPGTGGPFNAVVGLNAPRVFLSPSATAPLVTRLEPGAVISVSGRSTDAGWLRLNTPETRWIQAGSAVVNGSVCDLPDKTAEQNSGTTGGAIAYGQTQSRTFLDPFGHAWTFFSNPGSVVQITMTSATFDTYLLLYDPNGILVAQDNNSGGGTNAQINYTVTAPGEYTIVARGNAGVSGLYDLTLTLVSGPG